MSLIIGLTGGIGSGKSFIAKLFANLGVSIIDADQIAHTITASGGCAIEAIAARFGTSYLLSSGALNRTKLRQTVFADIQARRDLEAITHPLIRAAMDMQTQQLAHQAYVIQVIPLLLESHDWKTRVNRILVVDCSEETQIARVKQRSQLSETEISAIMQQQISRPQRLACADDIIDNHAYASVATLSDQIAQLHKRYIQLANE